MPVHAIFKYVVPWLKSQHLGFALVLTPRDNIFEYHTY